MTEASNDDDCCYYHKVRRSFAEEWNERFEARANGVFPIEDMMEAHASPLAYLIAGAIKSGYDRDTLMAGVISMVNEAVDMDAAMMQAPTNPKELN